MGHFRYLHDGRTVLRSGELGKVQTVEIMKAFELVVLKHKPDAVRFALIHLNRIDRINPLFARCLQDRHENSE